MPAVVERLTTASVQQLAQYKKRSQVSLKEGRDLGRPAIADAGKLMCMAARRNLAREEWQTWKSIVISQNIYYRT